MASIDELVVYCVYRILRRGEECTFERLVAECFTLYPREFCLRGYEHWPDSARVNKAWLRCRTDRGWMTGSVKDGFRLTSEGEKVALKIESDLGAGSYTEMSRPTRASRAASARAEGLVATIRQTSAFVRYKRESSAFKITEMELRSLLGATMETPPRVLRETINAYRNAANEAGDNEVGEFLSFCLRNMSRILNPSAWGTRHAPTRRAR
jgi:hypothetical protein